jgi:hypothetical protein
MILHKFINFITSSRSVPNEGKVQFSYEWRCEHFELMNLCKICFKSHIWTTLDRRWRGLKGESSKLGKEKASGIRSDSTYKCRKKTWQEGISSQFWRKMIWQRDATHSPALNNQYKGFIHKAIQWKSQPTEKTAQFIHNLQEALQLRTSKSTSFMQEP